ncbi:MAG: radical SAM family heme chaperone HemW [Lachnospiraceae bacterium]|nr:radical SAM family heme chaperone HemW [Lachnospiraceae bacterium]
MSDSLGLYLHIPFCAHKCNYCDFLSSPMSYEARKRYVDALCEELRYVAKSCKERRVDTIFFGGGTPSILSSEAILQIMTTIYRNFSVSKDAEISIEANPGAFARETCETWAYAGINRLSMGLQSACNEELKLLGRIHSTEEFLESFLMAREIGFSNINVDLMCALPHQTPEKFYGTLETVASLSPEHLSVYNLIVEEGTLLAKWVEEGRDLGFPDEDTERQMYHETRRILAKHGYERYEISNYAKKGYECKHNLRYWERKDYLGVGIGAASLWEGKRFSNTVDFERYVSLLLEGESKDDFVLAKLRENEEVLTKEDCMAEFMFLGLRKIKGVSQEEFYKNFDIPMDSIYHDVIERHVKLSTLQIQGDALSLTEYGLDVSNSVMADFLFD